MRHHHLIRAAMRGALLALMCAAPAARADAPTAEKPGAAAPSAPEASAVADDAASGTAAQGDAVRPDAAPGKQGDATAGDGTGGDAAPALPALTLRPSPEANKAYAACLQPDMGGVAMARCMRALEKAHPNTDAAMRAAGATDVLKLQLKSMPEDTAEDRQHQAAYELAGWGGAFALWNGVAAHIMTADVVGRAFGDAAAAGLAYYALTTAAVTAGGAYGAYKLGDVMKVNAAGSQLTGSSLVWGTIAGVAATNWLNNALPDDFDAGWRMRLSLMTVMAGGWLAGGSALAFGGRTELTPGQVSVWNSGGWLGASFGLTAGLTYLTANPSFDSRPSNVAAALFVLGTGAGMASTLLLPENLKLRRGTVFLADVAGVGAGLVGALSAGAVLAFVSPNNAAAAIGMVGGTASVAATGAFLAVLLSLTDVREDEFALLGVQPTIGVPVSVQDSTGAFVTLAPVLAFKF